MDERATHTMMSKENALTKQIHFGERSTESEQKRKNNEKAKTNSQRRKIKEKEKHKKFIKTLYECLFRSDIFCTFSARSFLHVAFMCKFVDCVTTHAKKERKKHQTNNIIDSISFSIQPNENKRTKTAEE